LSFLEEIAAAIRKAFMEFFGIEPEERQTLSHEAVARVLDDLALDFPTEDLDWRHSVVDLLKVLKLDSSLVARAELAASLGLPPVSGSSAENTKLHEAVVEALMEHRIELPH
jgi:hypothetical protein